MPVTMVCQASFGCIITATVAHTHTLARAGVQSLLGVIAKTLYGSSLIIWDHGILWRERLLALTTLPPTAMPKFVQIGFAGLTRLCATLAYATANCVCPCTSIQNVQWEAYLGGGKYNDDTLSRNMYRKISPVLNGMDVDRFRVNKVRSVHGLSSACVERTRLT